MFITWRVGGQDDTPVRTITGFGSDGIDGRQWAYGQHSWERIHPDVDKGTLLLQVLVSKKVGR